VGPKDFGEKPIGTGPFIFRRWVKDSYIEVIRNPRYWGGVHPVTRIVFRIIPEDGARVAAVEAGEVDLGLLIPIGAIDRLRRRSDLQVVTFRGLRKFYVGLDTKFGGGHPALKDKRVRLALNYAVDKRAIVALFKGQADILQGQYLTPVEEGFNPDIKAYPYDPERAKNLLAQAGYAQGFPLQFTYTVGRYSQDREMGQLIASNFEKIGLKVTQRALEYGTYIGLFDTKKVGSHLIGLLSAPDPVVALTTLVEERFEYHSLEARPEIVRLLTEASSTIDKARRRTIFHRISQIMVEDPPVVFLMVPRDIYAVSNRVKGFQPRLDQLLGLSKVDLD
jgi:peptide/nickel transport system substrate-binding protein